MQKKSPRSDVPTPEGAVVRALRWWPTLLFAALATLSWTNAVLDRADTEDLARRPSPRPSGLAHWIEGESVGPYLSDRVAFRADIRRLHGWMLWASGDGNEDVVRGREDWLFYADSLVASEGPNWLPRRPARSVVRLSNALENTGRPRLVVVAPNKASIYPDYLPPAAQRQQELNTGRLARIRKLARQGAPETFVDIFDGMRESARSAVGGPLYNPSDTHWNVRGAAVAAAEIVHRLGGTWEPEALRLIDMEGRLDLVALLGLQGRGPRLSAEVAREGVLVEQTRDAGEWVQYTTRSAGTPLLPNVVVIQDSFGDALRLLLPAYFETTTFVSYGAALTEELQAALDAAEIVVFVTVERTFVRMSGRNPAPLWPQTRRILARLAEVPLVSAPPEETPVDGTAPEENPARE